MTTQFQHFNQSNVLQVKFTLSVQHLPESVQKQATAKAKEAYVMALLEAGEISSGKAGSLLDLPRTEVIERMEKWGIPLFDNSLELGELQQEVEQANRALVSKED
jgi:predicted HTH domain antitoxin